MEIDQDAGSAERCLPDPVNLERLLEDLMALLTADRLAAEASIAHSRALLAQLGDPPRLAPVIRPVRKPTSRRGKSTPNLDQWLRRALPDGTLPQPTDRLVIPERVIQQGLAGGYIRGRGHPYLVTKTGRAYAVACVRKGTGRG